MDAVALFAEKDDSKTGSVPRQHRLVYVSDLLGPHDFRILERLRAKGHAVTLVTFIADIDRPNFQISGYDVRTIPGLDIRHRVDLAGGRDLLRVWRRARYLKSVLAEVRPDLVYAGWVQTSGLISVLSGFHPLLLMPYGSDVLLEPYGSHRARWLARFVLRRADLITVDADAMKQAVLDVAGLSPDRIVMIPWGADLGRYGCDYDTEACKRALGWEGHKVVLKNRTLRPVYAHDDFLKAMAVVARAEPSLLVAIVSDGPLRGELQALAFSLGIAGQCQWLGYTDSDTFRTALRACDVYVNASRSDGMSVSLQEAVASGKAIVVSDNEGNRQLIRDGVNGLTFPPGDVDGMAAAVSRLFRDAALKVRMEAGARAVDRRLLDRDARIDQIAELFDGLVR